MSDEPTVLFEKEGAVGRLILNRPGVINAFNVQMRDDLYAALQSARDDPDIRAALISGAGDRGFCAGADLTEFGTAPSQVIARQVRWERDLWGLFGSIQKPLVAALHGYVIGSGVEIACLCDLRVASKEAIFRMPETALGMVPAAGGSQMLPRTIGQGHAMKMLLSNDAFDAETALKIGLVHRVVERDSLEEASLELANSLSKIPPALSAGVKRSVAEGLDMSLSRGLDLETRLAMSIAAQIAAGT